MNKLIQLLCVIAGCLAAQVGIASAPAPQALNKDQLVSGEVLMKALVVGLEEYYDKYSHSLEIMKARKNKEYYDVLEGLCDIVKRLDDREKTPKNPMLNTITDYEANTALILAAKYNCSPLIIYLIEQCGVTNFDAKNIYGRTAYDYVRRPSDRIGSSELDDEDSVKVEGDQIVKLKHKPVIHGNKSISEYLKSKRLKYKFDQAAARDPRLTALRAKDAKRAKQRAERNGDKKDDKKLQAIREKTRADIAARTENERMQALEAHNDTPAQQIEEAARLASIQAPKAQENAQKVAQEKIKQDNNHEFKLKMERIQAERNKKMLQAWKWAALESKRKKQVEQNGNSHAFKMRAVHEDSYWHARYQGDAHALVLKNEFVRAESLNTNDAVQWWHEHNQDNCAVCKKYRQAQLAAAAQPKQLERRKSF